MPDLVAEAPREVSQERQLLVQEILDEYDRLMSRAERIDDLKEIEAIKNSLVALCERIKIFINPTTPGKTLKLHELTTPSQRILFSKAFMANETIINLGVKIRLSRKYIPT